MQLILHAGHFLRVYSVLLVLALSFSAYAEQSYCGRILSQTLSIQEVTKIEGAQDTDLTPVVIATDDIAFIDKIFPLTSRPDFSVIVFSTEKKKTWIGLVPNPEGKPIAKEHFVGQQVSQWQILNFQSYYLTGIVDVEMDGRIQVSRFGFLSDKLVKVNTNLMVAQPHRIETVSFNQLLTLVRQNPKIHIANERPTPYKNLIRYLFGRTWIRIFKKHSIELNAMTDSKKLLNTQQVYDSSKEKSLHVVGELFTAKMQINKDSKYTGSLAPGQYHVLARLSSGMKNLEIREEDGSLRTNSLAIGMLIFKSEDNVETPSILFVQDSLRPIANPAIRNYRLTNNPAFSFRPTSIREFFEAGLTVAGVAFSSFIKKIDSGRGLQANYRSALAATANGVNIQSGELVNTTRFISLELQAKVNPMAATHTEAIREDKNAKFAIQASDNGMDWQSIGALTEINWLSIDSHSLTFPHGLSGTIDPNTLRPSTSSQGIGGLLLPTEVIPITNP